MKSSNNRLFIILLIVIVVIVALVAAVTAVWTARKARRATQIELREQTTVSLSATQIESIRSIGQWEFLAIDDEEIVDTTRNGFFSNDYLVRVYYGTLRLGIDLSDMSIDNFSNRGDTLCVTLPPVGLLDTRFIDEARTRAFHENGTWTSSDRDDLYRRAQAKMTARCLTANNLETARQLASQQVKMVLEAMGYDYVEVNFCEPPQQK